MRGRVVVAGTPGETDDDMRQFFGGVGVGMIVMSGLMVWAAARRFFDDQGHTPKPQVRPEVDPRFLRGRRA